MRTLLAALRQRWPLLILVLLNVGAALFVGLDLHRRLSALEAAPLVATPGPSPTMVPPPTARLTWTPEPSPTPVPPTETPTPLPGNLSNVLIDDDRLSYEPDFYAAEVQAFLEEQGSALAQATVPVMDKEDTFAHALTAHCIRYGLNPKVILTLLELQSGLVRSPKASPEALNWAFGFRNKEWQGLERQLQWVTYLLTDNFREEDGSTALLTDGTAAPIPGEANAATRSLLRLLSYTANAKRFDVLRSAGPGSFVAVYRDLFGEDPRLPAQPPSEPERAPFLQLPFSGSALISSYFDHEYPVFHQNGWLLAYTGERGYQSYDGHDGWDYALDGGTPVLAAANGRVVFAGWVDTLCPTPAGLVVLDHGGGYRTLYWHLQKIEAKEGAEVAQGDRIGTVGSTGCSSGPHLHFGVEYLGRDIDPYGWCGSTEVTEDPWAQQPAGVTSRWLWANQPSPCPFAAGGITVDDADSTFTKSPALWYEAPVGYNGHSFWAVAVSDSKQATHRVVWRPDLAEGGRYFLYAHIPWYDTGRPDAVEVHYQVRHNSGETTVTIDQAHSAGLWVPLGAYYFGKGAKGYVYLDEVAKEEGTTVWFDAVVWVKE